MCDDIRADMLRHKVTGKELAKKAGITEYTLSRWLNNEALPNYKKRLLKELLQELIEEREGAAV